MTANPTPSRTDSDATDRTDAPARSVSKREATYAAKARVTADSKRGAETPQWIKDLAADKAS